MEWFSKLFGRAGKAKREYPNLTRGKDPLELWNKTGELGDGAFGKVYKTENRDTGVLAALKRVPIQDETELEDFMVEIDILTECKHPNIVGLYKAFFFDSALWIFIEFCAGGAVDDVIIELDHGLSEPQIRCIAHQTLLALECLHSNGCIHRDLKAGNVLLCSDGSIRLGDFGVSARAIKGRQKRDTFIGTPYWMAPEVVVCETNKDNPYDSKADIWSTGITLIEMADMNPPYHEMSPMRVLLKIIRTDPPRLELPHKWSKDFNNFLAKCLTKNPEDRASATELLQHSFLSSVTDHKPLRALYQEVKSEVVEVVEELAEDADLTKQEEHTETMVAANQEPSIMTPNDIGPEPEMILSTEGTPMNGELQTMPPVPHEPPTESSGMGPPPVMLVEDPSDPAAAMEMKPPSPAGSASSSETGTPAATPHKESTASSGNKGEGYKYGTLSRVRKFRVDGEVIQSTTRRIVEMKANKTLRDNKRYQEMRKSDFHQLKRLQREEMKETTVFYHRIKGEREAQEKKSELEQQEVERRFEVVSEAMSKKHRKEVEKLEQQQLQEFKSKAKTLKADQTKFFKAYKEQQKDEEKMSLRRLERSLPKSERKQVLQKCKTEALLKRQENERAYSQQLASEYEQQLNQVLEKQKTDMKATELMFLNERQDLERNHTNELWEMEQRQKQDKHQMLKQELREAFHMQRHQMHSRHQREIELQAKRDQFRLDELRQQHLLEKRQVPKKLKSEHKAVVTEMRKGRQKKNVDAFKGDLKRVEEQYQRRFHMETELMSERHEHELATLKAELDANMRELQEIQNEKKMMLTQHENNKLKERDEQHTHELRDWRGDLTKRRQALEDKFLKERGEHERFYSTFTPPHHPLQASQSIPIVDGRVKAASFSSTRSSSSHSRPSRANRSSLQPLDEVASSGPSTSLPPSALTTRQVSNGSNV